VETPSQRLTFRRWAGLALGFSLSLAGCRWWTVPSFDDAAPNQLVPAEAAQPAQSPDTAARVAAIRALGQRPPADAQRRLAAALEDQDLQVRLAAIAVLGELGGSEAMATLERLTQDRGEAVRAAAVSALAAMHAEPAVLKARSDKSWRVRLAVAEALANYADRPAAAAARELLDDPSPTVQLRVLGSVGKWPPEQAAPILWEAMGNEVYLTRQAAAGQLAALWPPAGEFPVDGPPHQRAEFLRKRRDDFRREFGGAEAAALAGAAAASRAASRPPLPPAKLAEVEQWVGRLSDPQAAPAAREAAVAALARFGPGLVEALECLALDRRQPLPESVYREVLPQGEPAFAALKQLASEEVPVRRQAADRLAELAQRQPLRPLAVERLASLAQREPDALVWRGVFRAVAADGSEPSIRLAYAALSHAAAEVRRSACEHLAAHPSPRHANALLPALEDPQVSVVTAAARALGAVGRAADAEPLKRLLASANESVRLEAATALARCGEAAGPAALGRLSYSRDPAIRRQAAVAMGELGDPIFAPTLVRLLEDQHAVRLAALESLPKVTGRDPPASPGQSSASVAERVEFWRRAVGRGQ